MKLPLSPIAISHLDPGHISPRSEDLYDVIGPFLLSGCPDVEECQISKLCERIYEDHVRRDQVAPADTSDTVLSAPIQISNMKIVDDNSKLWFIFEGIS